MLDKIIDGVYLTGASNVITKKGREQLTNLKITHVLTISAMPINPEAQLPSITYEYIYSLDSPCQDILGTDVLTRGVSFIESAVSAGGRVVVHCEVGVSRSVTLVTAYLMKKYEWDERKAIMHVQVHRPIAYPNEGFIAQLRIYRKLGYRINHDTLSSSIDYRNWCIETGNAPESGIDPRAAKFVKKLDTSAAKKEDDTDGRGNKFRCSRCREPLFYSTHIMRHKRPARGDSDGDTVCSFGYLVEPLSWMDTAEYQGKIACPKCGEKLGNFCWGGRSCQGEIGQKCGEQVQPWVHLHKNKVDEVRSIAVGISAQSSINNDPTDTPPILV